MVEETFEIHIPKMARNTFGAEMKKFPDFSRFSTFSQTFPGFPGFPGFPEVLSTLPI